MLDQKTVLVSGGAGLLGRKIAEAVLAAGGTPIIADVNAEQSATLATELSSRYSKTVPWYAMDITEASSIRDCLERYSAQSAIDALVCAAYPRNKQYGAKLPDVTYADFCENVNMHLGGYFLLMREYSEFAARQGHGNVVVMSSIYGVIAPRFEIYDGTPMTMPVEYAATKVALQMLVRYFAKYYRGHNIRYNCVSPGGILDKQPQSFLDGYARFALNKGMLEDKDIMGAVLFLLSDGAQYVNGQNIVVDDGWTL